MKSGLAKRRTCLFYSWWFYNLLRAEETGHSVGSNMKEICVRVRDSALPWEHSSRAAAACRITLNSWFSQSHSWAAADERDEFSQFVLQKQLLTAKIWAADVSTHENKDEEVHTSHSPDNRI